ncbi:coiled-coil domain-containing protein 89 isoform X2 [Pristis pectinata]|uniref:coiled-coil domain-containing protein 89 isoform X2 n=1 Tax=Pristis pectinata TaxID=685728 RepID=UPI00223D47B6|nr:coiled-coil domain-containing protein 89 isoform X2 [Pristis pectinata]
MRVSVVIGNRSMEPQRAAERSPRNFNQMMQESKQVTEIDTVPLTLEKLRGLSQEDKTENAMLRSRIDEQSQLICILKQRADEFIRRCQTLEAINADLENQCENFKQQLEGELKLSAQLEERFMDLALNHQEIIKFKDEYKRQNSVLSEQNEKLQRENENLFCKALQEKDDQILKLSNELGECLKQCNMLEQECKQITQNLQTKESDFLEKQVNTEKFYQDKVQSLKAKLKETEDRCNVAELKQKEAAEIRSHKETEFQQKILLLTQEKEELLKISMERGKIVQDKQKEIQLLQEKLKLTEKAKKDAEDRFQYEATMVNESAKVKALQQQYHKYQKIYTDLEREFEAFKKHSNNLLTKEKELNAKLRHLSDARFQCA